MCISEINYRSIFAKIQIYQTIKNHMKDLIQNFKKNCVVYLRDQF